MRRATAACVAVCLTCGALSPSRATEPESLTAPAVLKIRVEPSDVVRLEVWNNDGRLLVGRSPEENLGAVKAVELWNDDGELSLLLDGGTDNVEYQVSVEIWKSDSIFAPHSAFSFGLTGNATHTAAPRTVVDLGEVDGNLSVRVVDTPPTAPEDDDRQIQESPALSESALTLDRRLPFSALPDADLSIAHAILTETRTTVVSSEPEMITDWLPSGASHADDLRDLLRFDFAEEIRTPYRNGFSYVGPALDDDLATASQRRDRDKEIAKLWTDWSLGNRLSLNMSAEEQRELIGRQLDKFGSVDRLTGLSANLALSDWPYVTSSVWYKEGVRNTHFVPAGKSPYEADVQNSGVSLSLRNAWSSHNLSASYSDSYDRSRPETLTESVSQSFSSSLFPTSTLSIGAAISINEDWLQGPAYVWAGKYLTESVWATLRPPNADFRLTWSQYADSYATLDGSMSYGGLYNSITLAYDEISLFDQRFPLAFTVQRGSYIDNLDPAANSQGTSFRLQFGAQ